jgi:hypothetical protein
MQFGASVHDDGGSLILQNITTLTPDHMALHARKQQFQCIVLLEVSQLTLGINFSSPFIRSTYFILHILLILIVQLITKSSHYIIFTHLFFLGYIWNLHNFFKINYSKNHEKQRALKQAAEYLSKKIMHSHSNLSTFQFVYLHRLTIYVLNTKLKKVYFMLLCFILFPLTEIQSV